MRAQTFSRRARFTRRWLVLVSMATATAGCSWGTRPSNFAPARGPRGAQVAVRVVGEARDRVGELYAADSLGLIVREKRLVRVRWEQVGALNVDRLGGDYDVAPGQRADEAKRQRLMQVSRFRDGLQGKLLDTVLTALQQTTIDEIPRE
jgi:hypothetical protein